LYAYEIDQIGQSEEVRIIKTWG